MSPSTVKVPRYTKGSGSIIVIGITTNDVAVMVKHTTTLMKYNFGFLQIFE